MVSKRKLRKSDGAKKHRRCRRIFALLSEYLDGRLSRANANAIETHMCDCAPCRRFLRELEKTINLCRAIRTPPMTAARAREVRDMVMRACGESSVGS